MECQPRCRWSVNQGVSIKSIDQHSTVDVFSTHDPSLVRQTPDQEVSHFDRGFLKFVFRKLKLGAIYIKCDNKVFTSKISQMTSLIFTNLVSTLRKKLLRDSSNIPCWNRKYMFIAIFG